MAEAAAKKERVEIQVTMNDGRQVIFVGTRKQQKETLIDNSKIQLDEAGGLVVFRPGAVRVRMDFVNGETRTFDVPLSLYGRAIGHGLEQKFGDETAGAKDIDDAVVAVDDLYETLRKGSWTVRSEGGDSYAGASIVIRALMEASGKDQPTIKAFLQKMLDDAKAKGETLTRKALYDSFRAPNTKVGTIIARLEAEKLAKSAKVDADAKLSELMSQG